MSDPRGAAGPRSGAFSPSTRIREARPRDLEPIVAIERRSHPNPWSADSLRAMIARDGVAFLVADDLRAGGGIRGFGILRWAADEGEIANLAVDPEVRGRGLGRALLEGLLARAGDRGVVRIFLEVRDSNEPARALYASRGFRPVGVRRQYYERPAEDALILRLDLPDPAPTRGPGSGGGPDLPDAT